MTLTVQVSAVFVMFVRDFTVKLLVALTVQISAVFVVDC